MSVISVRYLLYEPEQGVDMRLTISVLIASTVIAAGAHGEDAYRPPPQGGAVVIPEQPIWLTGVEDDASVLAEISTEFPTRQSTDHLEVINAGFYLNMQYGELQAIYSYELNLKKPFPKKVFSRMILEDPLNPNEPIVYEHFLAPEEKSTKVTHGPVRGVEANGTYTLTFEVYSDRRRKKLVDRIVQKVIASFDNSGPCIEPSDLARSILLPAITVDGLEVPTSKLAWPCKI